MNHGSKHCAVDSADRTTAVACVIYGAYNGRRGREQMLFWDELPASAQAYWRYIAGEVLRYLDVLLWEEA